MIFCCTGPSLPPNFPVSQVFVFVRIQMSKIQTPGFCCMVCDVPRLADKQFFSWVMGTEVSEQAAGLILKQQEQAGL